MPAQAKIATALAMSLALVGAGTSLAQSTDVTARHAAYVTIVDVEQTPDTVEMRGTVSCEVPLHEEVVRRVLDRQACLTDDYAYAYPGDKPAPWTSSIEEVDQSMYVDEQGAMWHVAEVSYHALTTAPEGGPELVQAMASEIVPQDGDEGDLSYALPVDEELMDQSEADLIVDVGPSPEEASQRAPSSAS